VVAEGTSKTIVRPGAGKRIARVPRGRYNARHVTPTWRKDTGGLWAAAAAIALTIGLAAVLAWVSRSVNRPPAVTTIDVHPAIVAAGGTAVVRVRAEDPDGDALRFEYKAERGRVTADPARPAEARYEPPANGPIADRVTVTVTDAKGLSSSSDHAISLEAAPTPAAVATPEVEPVPTAPVTVEAATPAPTRKVAPLSVAKATPAGTRPPPPPTPRQNRPPVLDGGFDVGAVGNNPIRLMATGHDPDDDPISHEWDMGGCFEVVTESESEVEVKFTDGCTGGNVELRWTDPHGAMASTRWRVRK